jgi:hypothetical protein
MVNANPDEEFEFLAVRLLQHAKTTDIERLGKVGGMCKKTKGDNAVVFIELLKLGGEMAFVAV